MSAAESKWVKRWATLVDSIPEPLQLLIPEASADGSVEVYKPEGHGRDVRHTRWMNRLRRHLESFPEGDAWLLPNTDGWHFGKGTPTVTSSSSYGAGGACSSHSDDLSEHYLVTIPIDHGEAPDGFESVCVLPSHHGLLNFNFVNR